MGKKAKHDPALFAQAKNPKKHCNPKEQLLANKAKQTAAGKVRKGLCLSACHNACVSISQVLSNKDSALTDCNVCVKCANVLEGCVMLVFVGANV